MTVGTGMVTRPHYSGHNEAILYRTRTEILTDQRVLLDGTTYTFDQIDAVAVVRLRLYLPFQALRILGVIGAVAFAWLTLDSLCELAMISMLLYGLLAVGSGALTVVSTATVPTHAIRLTVGDKRVYMMHDTSASYLERINAAIQHQINRR
ncbi:MAG: hypothetical protein JXA10_03435 [Anaerolineae bacterium]|nr:hypothetical protein [Anaerolineae bacterium]